MNAPLNPNLELQKYDSLLRAFAYNLTRNKEETEDLIQDTYYRALSNYEKFTNGTNFKAWLFTIMRNVFINNYRKRKRSSIVGDHSDDQHILNNNRTDSNGSENLFLSEDIQRAIDGVSEDFTRPFLLYYKGFQYQEIAEIMQLPLGTVKSRIFFARKELQSRLKGMERVNLAHL